MSIEQKLSVGTGVAAIVTVIGAGVYDSLGLMFVGCILCIVAGWMDSI